MDPAFPTPLASRILVAALFLMGALFAPANTPGATLDEHLEALQVQVPPEPVPAPAFALQGLDGHPLTLQDMRGNVVFLNFWATWCVPCRAEMPAMEKLQRTFRGRGLAVVAVNVKESKSQVEAFRKELRVTFPVVLDPEGTVSRRFAVRGLPVTFLLDREGKILWKSIGSREWDGPHGLAYLDLLLQVPPR